MAPPFRTRQAMSNEFMRRLKAKAIEDAGILEHVIWRLTKNGRLAEARMRIVPIGNGRPELRTYVQHPTPAFQLLWSKVTTQDEGNAFARQQRQLFEAKGWALQVPGNEGGGDHEP